LFAADVTYTQIQTKNERTMVKALLLKNVFSKQRVISCESQPLSCVATKYPGEFLLLTPGGLF
jgi:hypothetical protein